MELRYSAYQNSSTHLPFQEFDILA